MVYALPLFEDSITQAPPTEGIKYAGSKLKLLPQILSLAKRVPARNVTDAFAGTTRVSQAFAQMGYDVVCNDRAIWSKTFANCYLRGKENHKHYQTIIDHLNAVEPIDGWFTEHYGALPNGGSAVHTDGLKKPWQAHNTRKLDGIREEIDRLKLSPDEKAVALTSLILALDQVDSTLGHFVSYLKEWSSRSYKNLNLKVPQICSGKGKHQVYRRDVFELCDLVETDLAYLDPPYGSNNEKMPPSRVRYASYYHLWTTVILNDKPDISGKALRRTDTSDQIAGSIFEEFRKNESGRFLAVEAIDRLLSSVKANWVILSYSSGGRATATELNDVLSRHGTVLDAVELEYKKNVMAGMKWTNEWLRDAEEGNKEFMFLIEKT